MKSISFFFAFCLVLIISSCGKTIPGETMDGRGTFYCKINDKDFFPDCNSFACQEVDASYFTLNDAVVIEAINDNHDNDFSIYIYVYMVTSTYSLDHPYDPEGIYNNTFIVDNCSEYYLRNSEDLEIIISKVDLNNRIISGTFSGIIRDTSNQNGCGYKEFSLTEGVFDLPITI